MKMNHKLYLFFLVLFFSAGNIYGQELTILHTNDMHSKLVGYGPESEYSPMVINNDSTRGGFARLAALFKEIKAEAPEKTLIVDAGDFLMGSLFHVPEAETGFQLNLMKQIGYDYITLGNHEFEYGPTSLSELIKSAKSKGEIPQIMASNINFSKESPVDDALEAYSKDKTILPYIIFNKNGIKIGIIGLLGIDAAEVAPASKPVTFSKPYKEAEKIAKYLKSTGKVDLVVALSHSGLYPNKENNGYYGEDIDLAKKVPTIDIIISGHTHIETPQFIKIGNTFVVQTGSYVSNLGEINLKFEKGKISDFKFRLIPVDDKIMGDKKVNDEIEDYIKIIDEKYLSPAGLSYRQIVGKTNFDLKCDFTNLKLSNLGPFLADASKYYLHSTGNDADFSLVASGTIREDILKGQKGILTTADIFRVMSLGKGYDNIPGYPLAKIYVTAHEVKKLMEILVMSRAKGGDGFIYFSGIKTTIDSKKGFLRKVQKIEINGKEIDYSKKNLQLFCITANTYLLSFIGRIKKMSHGLVKIVPKDKDGKPIIDMKNQLVDIDPNKAGVQEAKEWIAVIEYLKSFKKDSDMIPVIPDIYKMGDNTVVDIAK
jgi:5'-nucleotidase / UDP-sugar diphosphatase